MAKTITVTKDNGVTTLTIVVGGDSAVLDPLIESAAHYDYNADYGDHGTDSEPKVWEDLTNLEKLDCILGRVVSLLKGEAASYDHTVEAEAGKLAAEEKVSVYKDV